MKVCNVIKLYSMFALPLLLCGILSPHSAIAGKTVSNVWLEKEVDPVSLKADVTIVNQADAKTLYNAIDKAFETPLVEVNSYNLNSNAISGLTSITLYRYGKSYYCSRYVYDPFKKSKRERYLCTFFLSDISTGEAVTRDIDKIRIDLEKDFAKCSRPFQPKSSHLCVNQIPSF